MSNDIKSILDGMSRINPQLTAIKLMESGDILNFIITDDESGVGGLQGANKEGKPKDSKKKGGDEETKKGEGGEEKGQGGKEKDGGGNQKGKDKENEPKIGGEEEEEERKLKVGDKVRIRSTGKEGIITNINPDGTYEITEVENRDIFDVGGVTNEQVDSNDADITTETESTETVVLGNKIGDFPESEIEVVEDEGQGKGDGKGKEEEDEEGENQGEDGGGEDDNEGTKPPPPPQIPPPPPDPFAPPPPTPPPPTEPPPPPPPPPPVPTQEQINEFIAIIDSIIAYPFQVPLVIKTFLEYDILGDVYYKSNKSFNQIKLSFYHNLYSQAKSNDGINQSSNLDLIIYYAKFEQYINWIFYKWQYIGAEIRLNRDQMDMLNDAKAEILANPYLLYEWIDPIQEFRNYIALDKEYAKYLPLKMLGYPELFSNQYINAHLDIMFEICKLNQLCFSNNFELKYVTQAYTKTEDFYNSILRINVGLNLISVNRLELGEGYEFCMMEEIMRLGGNLRCNLKFYNTRTEESLTEIQYAPIIATIVTEIEFFYQILVFLYDKTKSKEYLANKSLTTKFLLDFMAEKLTQFPQSLTLIV